MSEKRKHPNSNPTMSDTTPIPGQGATYSYGRDDYGEYGSALQAETEFQIPEPLDFTPNSDL